MIFKVAVIGVGGTFLSLIVGQFHKEYSVFIILAVCILLTALLTQNMEKILEFMKEIEKNLQIGDVYFKLLLKLFAIAYVSQTTASICSDLGHQAIAFQIEMIGKIAIFSLSLPVLRTILFSIEEMVRIGGS